MFLSFKTEIFPNYEQKQNIQRYFGVRRFVFNSMLMYLKQKHGDNLKLKRKDITIKEISEYRKVLRKEYKEILSTAPSQVVETVFEDFSQAIQSLWKKGKEIKLRKKKDSNSVRISRKNETNFRYEDNSKYLTIVKLGTIKMAETLRWSFNDNIKAATIKKSAGRYFISIIINVDDSEIKKYPKTNQRIAFDWGLKTFLTGYDGKDFYECNFDHNKMNKLDINIRRKAKALSNRRYNSKNFFKAKTKLEKAYLDRVNYQESYLKELANYLAENYDEVILEDLKMNFLFKNHKLAKKVSERMFYKTKIVFYNKLSQSNKIVSLVDQSFPSTQMCSSCGHTFTGLEKLTLSNRVYNCPKCSLKMNRDDNASKNIYQYKNPEIFQIRN